MVASAARKKEWQKLVTQWRASGLSQRAFALEHGVTQKQISYWSRSLAATPPLPEFVPVRVMPASSAVPISLRSEEHGWTLTLPHDVPASWLAGMLRGCDAGFCRGDLACHRCSRYAHRHRWPVVARAAGAGPSAVRW